MYFAIEIFPSSFRAVHSVPEALSYCDVHGQSLLSFVQHLLLLSAVAPLFVAAARVRVFLFLAAFLAKFDSFLHDLSFFSTRLGSMLALQLPQLLAVAVCAPKLALFHLLLPLFLLPLSLLLAMGDTERAR